MRYQIIDSFMILPAPKTFSAPDGRTFSGFDRMGAEIHAEFGYFDLIRWPKPDDGKGYRECFEAITLDGVKKIQNCWEEIQIPSAVLRYDTKKVIEKMAAQNLLAVIRDALIAANMYEIMLLEPVLSMDDPRFIAVLTVVSPIAAENGISDISAWLEDCQ